MAAEISNLKSSMINLRGAADENLNARPGELILVSGSPPAKRYELRRRWELPRRATRRLQSLRAGATGLKKHYKDMRINEYPRWVESLSIERKRDHFHSRMLIRGRGPAVRMRWLDLSLERTRPLGVFESPFKGQLQYVSYTGDATSPTDVKLRA